MRHSDRLLNLITCITAFLFIMGSLWFPVAIDSAALWIVILSVGIIGIPHGAIDHIMAAELYDLNQTLKDHLLFYASYLLIMIVVGALWILFPEAGMALFLIISVYHFGQADMEDFLDRREPLSRVFYINRGLLIIGLIIFSDPLTTYPIMADAMQIDTVIFSELMPSANSSLLVIMGIYFFISVWALVLGRIKNAVKFVVDSFLLILFLLITGPLIGFAIYFALWHSAGHIKEMREFFEMRGKSLSVSRFYKKAIPFTIISIVGLAMLLLINVQFNLENQFLSLMFILISVLTLPHMLIVEKMYDEKA
ncbi:Brp/Blh family beta-carotene 15,15'-dioxygenase [Rhodohalobacter sp. 8-1]|uniref:Brp/Blh family beta-carotene 15,15'-dioxygenase n=1 Tax=Rhodohalobacter sp. 8-1 TaxID=3131972 RepID=UPI0030EC4B4C